MSDVRCDDCGKVMDRSDACSHPEKCKGPPDVATLVAEIEEATARVAAAEQRAATIEAIGWQAIVERDAAAGMRDAWMRAAHEERAKRAEAAERALAERTAERDAARRALVRLAELAFALFGKRADKIVKIAMTGLAIEGPHAPTQEK